MGGGLGPGCLDATRRANDGVAWRCGRWLPAGAFWTRPSWACKVVLIFALLHVLSREVQRGDIVTALDDGCARGRRVSRAVCRQLPVTSIVVEALTWCQSSRLARWSCADLCSAQCRNLSLDAVQLLNTLSVEEVLPKSYNGSHEAHVPEAPSCHCRA